MYRVATGLKAGQAVREDLRQHRDDAVGQVDAGAPVPRRRGRAPIPAERSGRRRRCGPPGSSGRSHRATSEMASSKSRAVAGSIVTVGKSRRSTRVPISASSNSLACSRASSRTSSSNVSGMLNARMTRQRIDPRLTALAEDLDDDPFAFEVRRRVADDLERDLVARPGPLGPGIADGDRLVERRAVDLDEARVAGLEIGARRRRPRPAPGSRRPALRRSSRRAATAW